MGFTVVSISEIENAMLNHLRTNSVVDGTGTPIADFDINADIANCNRFPAIAVATEKILFKKKGSSVVEWSPVVSLYMMFKSVAGESARRKGLYPIVEGAIQLLQMQTLGLSIEPLEPDTAAVELYSEQLKSLGLIGYKAQFKTSFDVSNFAQDTGTKLLVSGIEYFAQPDAETAAVRDIVNLT